VQDSLVVFAHEGTEEPKGWPDRAFQSRCVVLVQVWDDRLDEGRQRLKESLLVDRNILQDRDEALDEAEKKSPAISSLTNSNLFLKCRVFLVSGLPV
jgi:hypothetical protein